MLDHSETSFFFLMKKTGDAIGDFDGWIQPDSRFSWMNASNSFCSEGKSGYTLQLDPLGTSSIAWSQGLVSGSMLKDSLENTLSNLHRWLGTPLLVSAEVGPNQAGSLFRLNTLASCWEIVEVVWISSDGQFKPMANMWSPTSNSRSPSSSLSLSLLGIKSGSSPSEQVVILRASIFEVLHSSQISSLQPEQHLAEHQDILTSPVVQCISRLCFCNQECPIIKFCFPKGRNCKQGHLWVVLVPKIKADSFGDGTSFIWGAINIIDWSQGRQCMGGQSIGLDIVLANKHPSCSRVKEGMLEITNRFPYVYVLLLFRFYVLCLFPFFYFYLWSCDLIEAVQLLPKVLCTQIRLSKVTTSLRYLISGVPQDRRHGYGFRYIGFSYL